MSASGAGPKVTHNSMCPIALPHVFLSQGQKRHRLTDVTKRAGPSYL